MEVELCWSGEWPAKKYECKMFTLILLLAIFFDFIQWSSSYGTANDVVQAPKTLRSHATIQNSSTRKQDQEKTLKTLPIIETQRKMQNIIYCITMLLLSFAHWLHKLIWLSRRFAVKQVPRNYYVCRLCGWSLLRMKSLHICDMHHPVYDAVFADEIYYCY